MVEGNLKKTGTKDKEKITPNGRREVEGNLTVVTVLSIYVPFTSIKALKVFRRVIIDLRMPVILIDVMVGRSSEIVIVGVRKLQQ